MNLRTEQEIINSWSYSDEIYVSVVCMTYNQEMYVKEAIDSFLRQDFDYKFEIIIHDDASTDTTPQIIKEYAGKYPSIISIIQQVDNKYSQQPTAPTLIALSEAKADYIALCEGDDYWLSTNKLQCQFLAMIENKQIKLSFHASKNLYPNGNMTAGVNLGTIDKICSLSDVIRGGGAFMPTASLMFKKELIQRFHQVLEHAPVGDFYMQVLGSIANGALYVTGLASAYRKDTDGSWSSSTDHWSEQKICQLLDKHELAINKLIEFVPDKDKQDLDYALMHELYVGSRIALFSKNYKLFQSLITRCKKSKFKFGSIYHLFCLLNNFPKLLHFFYQRLRSASNIFRVKI